MNKATIGGRDIRTNWATSKRVPQTTVSDPKAVAKASSEYNTTVYVGGIEKGRVNDASLREQFSRFGPIDGKNKTLFANYLTETIVFQDILKKTKNQPSIQKYFLFRSTLV